MSATHNTFGASGLNFRSTRSSATRTPGTLIVVRPRLTLTSPEIPAALISRRTRPRETWTSWPRRSSACTRREP
jgi:hypothetical protein